MKSSQPEAIRVYSVGHPACKWKSWIKLTNQVTGAAIPAMRIGLARADEQSGYSSGF
jgi:hypothetical protein